MKKTSTAFSLINLGCNKNLVDSQHLLGKILTSTLGEYYADPYDPAVELVYVNTCGFLSSAREEAQELIHRLRQKGKKVCMMGCALKYRETLDPSSHPFATEHLLSWEAFVDALSLPLTFYPSQQLHELFRSQEPRALTNLTQGFEYLKIAEGCDNACAFCIIPKIRGKQRSLPLSQVLEQCKNLVAQGVQEIILIAQDSTRYGKDLYGKPQLFELVEQIEQIPGDFLYRVLYLYPDLLTQKQLIKLAECKKFIPYFDLPLQHISPQLLQKMGRYYNQEGIYSLLETIQTHFPTHFIRTNIIVGFPGETDADQQVLKSFLQQGYFDNIALFEYHDEPLAKAFHFPDKIADTLLHQRFLELRQLVNQQLSVRQELLLQKSERGWVQEITKSTVVIRPWLHAPEIDEVYELPLQQIKKSDLKHLHIGQKISLFPSS